MGIKNHVQVSHEMSALEQVQTCAPVVVALVNSDSGALEAAVAVVKSRLGNQWTAHHALQLLSGRKAREAVERATPEERSRLTPVLQIAHDAAQSLGLAGRPKA